jgi:hypothetical protein
MIKIIVEIEFVTMGMNHLQDVGLVRVFEVPFTNNWHAYKVSLSVNGQNIYESEEIEAVEDAVYQAVLIAQSYEKDFQISGSVFV